MSGRRIILFGASGFLGGALIRWFRNQGDAVVAFSRDPTRTTPPFRYWNGTSPGDWISTLNGADAVINLCGRSVNCRYHARNRRDILNSRLHPTALIGKGISVAVIPPKVWINASSATIYRQATDRPMTEDAGEIGHGFSVEVCRAWEAALFSAPDTATRRVALRTSMVLANAENSVYPVLRRLTRAGLAGSHAGGGQMMSWIHHLDFCRAVDFVIRQPMRGPINVTTPHPVPNARFMHDLRESLNVPLGLPQPRWLLEMGAWMLRTETELTLKSRWVVPQALLEAGFSFEFPTHEAALQNLARNPGETAVKAKCLALLRVGRS